MTQVQGHAKMLGRRAKWSANISKPAQDDEGNGEKTQGERWLGNMIKVVLRLLEKIHYLIVSPLIRHSTII